jgi:hypothetical protein
VAAPLPGLVLWFGTIVFFLIFIHVLFTDQRLVAPMMALGLIIGIIWLIYVHLPRPARNGARWIVRKVISKGEKPKH